MRLLALCLIGFGLSFAGVGLLIGRIDNIAIGCAVMALGFALLALYFKRLHNNLRVQFIMFVNSIANAIPTDSTDTPDT